MATPIQTPNEPYVRVRLTRFFDGTQNQQLENLKLRIDTFDLNQSNSIFIIFFNYFS